MAKQGDNTILWVIGIVIFILVATHLEIFPGFAIVQKTVCIDNKISYYDFNSGTVSGKIGNAVQFNGNNSINVPVDSNANATIMWIKNYSKGDTAYYFLARIKGVNYVNVVQSSSRQILPAGPNFGLGFNGSVDEYATFTDLSLTTLADIYNNGSAREVCYTITSEENVTCKDYATSKVPNTGNGCLSYSGTFYPNCTYEWKSQIQYKIVNSKCEKQYYCSDSPLTLTQCQQELNASNTAAPVITSAGEVIAPGTGLNQEMFNIRGYSIKLIHLLISLAVIIVLIYFNRK